MRWPDCWRPSRLLLGLLQVKRGSSRSRGTAIFLLSAGLLLWQSFFYPLTLMALGALRGKRQGTRLGYTPALTVIIPAHNEAARMGRRLANLRDCEYPRKDLQIIVVDDGSTDGTGDIVESMQQEGLPALELVRGPERRGKTGAINLGLQKARGDLVLVTDVPVATKADALIRIVANFADDAVGGVSGTLQVADQVTLAQREEGLFWRLRNRLRLLEANVDSTPFLEGALFCFRRSLVPSVDPDSMADDMNVAFQVRRAGYRTIVDATVGYSKVRSASFRELNETKARRALGGLQELMRFRGMLLRLRYGLFGLLIMPSDLLFYLPLRPLAVATVGARLLRLTASAGPAARVALAGATLLAVSGIYRWRRTALPALAVPLFNEWIFLKAFLMWLLGEYDVVRWAQERADEAAPHRDQPTLPAQ